MLYDGQNAVQELSGSTPVVNRLTGGLDEFFSRTDSAGTTFPLTDALGSTIALTDSTGTVETQYTYDPYGGSTASGAMSTNTYQFTGRTNDGTGLYYYRARYYSPRFQRFISEDPVEYAGGPNLYAYVGGNPIIMIDPLGLCWIYKQSSGQMFHNSTHSVPVGTGYAGHGKGFDIPGYQDVGASPGAKVYDPTNAGPLPQGTYTIGPQENHVTYEGGQRITLSQSMALTPTSGNMFGRSGFLIHGDFKNDVNHMASEGCIVLGPTVRHTIGQSKDHCLKVVP